jgi:hypothetical protein
MSQQHQQQKKLKSLLDRFQSMLRALCAPNRLYIVVHVAAVSTIAASKNTYTQSFFFLFFFFCLRSHFARRFPPLI